MPTNLRYFVSSCQAAAVTTTVMNPVYVALTRSDSAFSPAGKTLGSIRHLIAKEGLQAFRLGANSMRVTTVMNSLQNMYREQVNRSLIARYGRLGFTHNLLATSSMKLLFSTALYPLDLVRIRQRANGDAKGLLALMRKIVRSDGLSGLYRGYSLALLRIVPEYTITQVTVDTVRSLLQRSFGIAK